MNKDQREKHIEAELEKRVKEELKPIDLEELYRDMIDECEPVVKVGGLSFTPSRIIEELDPIAFSCGVNDYADSLIGETISEEMIDGEYYKLDEVNDIRDEIESELDEEEEEKEWDDLNATTKEETIK
jgi:hypothetical protein